MIQADRGRHAGTSCVPDACANAGQENMEVFNCTEVPRVMPGRHNEVREEAFLLVARVR